MLDLPERLAELLTPVPFCGCWLYTGTRTSSNGYARVWWEGKERQLHKVVYELLVGKVAPGLVLDHKCRVRACAAFYHLEPVTHQVNTRRGDAVLFA